MSVWERGALSFGAYDAQTHGTKQFGVTVWGNAQRFGFQVNFWRWELQLMRERK